MLMVLVVRTLAMGHFGLNLGVAAPALGAHSKACQARLEGDEDGQEDGERTSVHWPNLRQTVEGSQANLSVRTALGTRSTPNLKCLLRGDGAFSGPPPQIRSSHDPTGSPAARGTPALLTAGMPWPHGQSSRRRGARSGQRRSRPPDPEHGCRGAPPAHPRSRRRNSR